MVHDLMQIRFLIGFLYAGIFHICIKVKSIYFLSYEIECTLLSTSKLFTELFYTLENLVCLFLDPQYTLQHMNETP